MTAAAAFDTRAALAVLVLLPLVISGLFVLADTDDEEDDDAEE